MRYVARVGDRELQIEVAPRGGGRFTVTLDGRTRDVARRGEGALLWLSIDGEPREATVVRRTTGAASSADGRPAGPAGAEYGVEVSGRPYTVTLLDPLRRAAGASARPDVEGPVEVRAIMPGKVAALLVKEGQEVKSGQGVVVVEAMKMENELVSPKEGRVTRIRVRPGETVESGSALFIIE